MGRKISIDESNENTLFLFRGKISTRKYFGPEYLF